MISAGRKQVGVVQTANQDSTWHLPVTVATTVDVPEPSTDRHVLVRVLAVAINPIDLKMVTKFTAPNEHRAIGCDFCGVVEDGLPSALEKLPRGTRVCGGVFPYSVVDNVNGAFSQWVLAESSLLIRVPQEWSDAEAAALGCACWSAAVLALFADPDGLALSATPTKTLQASTNEQRIPVLVYGGATATGTIAMQLLDLSGYSAIAVVSDESAPVALAYGAASSVSYTSPELVAQIRKLAGRPIRYALDCITSQESIAHCFAAIGRAGGRYACLESLDKTAVPRRAVHVGEMMGFEMLGQRVVLGDGDSRYTREASAAKHESGIGWTKELQKLVDHGLIKAHPTRIIETGENWWEGISEGLSMIQRGQVRGQKLVVRLPQPCD